LGAAVSRPSPAPPPARRRRDHSDSGADTTATPSAAVRPASLVAKPLVRLRVVEIGLGLGLLALVVRAGQVQLLEGRRYAASAAAQRTERVVLDARRGTLYDGHGTAIALTQATYHVGVAPND